MTDRRRMVASEAGRYARSLERREAAFRRYALTPDLDPLIGPRKRAAQRRQDLADDAAHRLARCVVRWLGDEVAK